MNRVYATILSRTPIRGAPVEKVEKTESKTYPSTSPEEAAAVFMGRNTAPFFAQQPAIASTSNNKGDRELPFAEVKSKEYQHIQKRKISAVMCERIRVRPNFPTEKDIIALLKMKPSLQMNFNDLLQELEIKAPPLASGKARVNLRSSLSRTISNSDCLQSDFVGGERVIAHVSPFKPNAEDLLQGSSACEGELFPELSAVFKGSHSSCGEYSRSGFAETRKVDLSTERGSEIIEGRHQARVQVKRLDDTASPKIKRRGGKRGAPRGRYKNIRKHMIDVFQLMKVKKIAFKTLVGEVSKRIEKEPKRIKNNIDTQIWHHRNLFSKEMDSETGLEYVTYKSEIGKPEQ